MSIAQGARMAELERQLLDVSRSLTDALALIKELQKRIETLEARPRPGRPPKES